MNFKETLLNIPEDIASARWHFWIILSFCLIFVFGSVVTVILGALSFFALLLRIWEKERFQLLPDEKIITKVILFYIAVSAFFSLIQPNLGDAIEFIVNNVTFLIFLTLLPVVRHFSTPKWKHDIYLAISIGLIISAIVLLIQLNVFAIFRPHAFVANALVLASIAAGFSLFALHRALEVSGKQRWLHFSAFISSGVIIFFTGARGAAIALLIAVSIFAIAKLKIIMKNMQKFIAIIIGIIALFSALVVIDSINPHAQTVSDRFDIFKTIAEVMADENRSASIDLRLIMLEGSWGAFLDSPWIGHGRQNVMIANEYVQASKTFEFSHLHNAFLTEMVSSGILGLITFLAVSFLPIFISRNSGKNLKVLALAFIACWLVTVSTNIGFYHDLMIIYFSMVLLFFYLLNSRHSESS